MKRIWIVSGIILGVIIIAGAGYLGFRSSQPESPVAAQAPETVSVERCDVEQSVTAPGSVVNKDEIDIEMPVNGKLDEILVHPGDAVSAGEVLATLVNDPLQLAEAQVSLAQAQTDIVNAQEALQKAISAQASLNLPRTDDLAVERARLNLATANTQLAAAQNVYDANSDLPEEDFQRLMALEALVAAKQAYRQALSSYNWITGHASTQDISAAEAKVSLAEADLALAQTNLSKVQTDLDILTGGVITAPSDGILLDSKAVTQRSISAGTSLFTLHSPQDIEIQTTVVEEDFPLVEVGQKVELFFDALPDAEATGTVSRILPKRTSGDRPLYTVYISLDEVPDHLVDGMTTDAAILISQRLQVLCLPRALVHASSGNTASVEVWNGLLKVERQIEIGLRGDVYLEILSGLEEGEQVVTR
jgi:multidrug efflux pump subunit AcrA (membrane-fusion protein)